MTGVLCVIAGMRAGSLDIEIITVGTETDGGFFTFRGFIDGLMGSISDGLFAPKGGAAIGSFYYDVGGQSLNFVISGTHTNDGWTTVRVGTADFTRASAVFSSSGGATEWVWFGVGTDPFGDDGTTTTAVFE